MRPRGSRREDWPAAEAAAEADAVREELRDEQDDDDLGRVRGGYGVQRGLSREQNVHRVGSELTSELRQQADGERAAEEEPRKPHAPTEPVDALAEPPGDEHGQRTGHADDDGDDQVAKVHTVVERQVGHDEAGCLEATPAPEPYEDEVADARGDEARKEDGEQRGAHPDSALHEQHARDERPAEEREIAANPPALARTLVPARPPARSSPRRRRRRSRAR